MARLAYLAVAMLILAAAATLFGPWVAAQQQSRPSVSDARSEAARARERANEFDRQARAALTASDKATLVAAALAARVQQVEAALSAGEADLRMLTRTRQTLNQRLARESAPVSRLVAGLQSQVRHPPILQLLQPGSIADAVHMRAVVGAVEPQIRARTSGLRKETARARALEDEALRLVQDRRMLQRQLTQRRNQLATLSAAERLKARRASGAADREAERAYAIAAETRDPSALIARLDRFRSSTAMAATPPRTGTLQSGTSRSLAPDRMPVAGPATQAAGARKGLTIAPRPNALVVAPGAGRVAFSGPYRGYGTIVIIEHAEGWTSLITGLAAVQVAPGQTVVGGSPLGQAGVQNPLVMIELRRNGTLVDPAVQLR